MQSRFSLSYNAMGFAAALALSNLFPLPSARADDIPHDKAFWRALAKDAEKLPAGVQASALAPELVADLASPDSELRDDLAYNLLTTWIYKKILTPDEVRPLMTTLLANLREKIGETGTDSVFRRSYSALILVAFVARDNDQSFLQPEEYRTLLDAALAYFEQERDLRGFDAQKGWLHSVAHTADLLKFLARNPRLTPTDQTKILDALHAKLRSSPHVYANGEDERLARIIISLARRDAPEKDALNKWIKATQADATFPEKPTPENLCLMQNARHLLISLWSEMSVDERPSPGLDAVREMVRAALKQIL